MEKTNILQILSDKETFGMKDYFDISHSNGCVLGEEALRKRMQHFLNVGDVVRVGRGRYCVPQNETKRYEHGYSNLAKEIAECIETAHPYLEFTIFELVQLNEFVNHQLAHNMIFLAIEGELADFVFDTMKEKYPGKVLLNPTVDIYHQYWYDDMIVIGRLITEAPKGVQEKWHTRIEKMLVDIIAETLILESISQSEYPAIYEDAFKRYVIDESCMFRYAKRRNAEKKIRKLISEKTSIRLRTR